MELVTIYQSQLLSSISSINHGFFGSEFNVGDYRLNENIEQIKKTLVKNQSDKYNLLHLNQAHSAEVYVVEHKHQALPEFADALVTKQSGVILGIKTADCLPILFIDYKNNIIAATHAGYKGAFNGILENTIKSMLSLGANTQYIKCCIGPSIAQMSYEVDQEFYNKFIKKSIMNKFLFIENPHNNDHYFFDLKQFAKLKLLDLNLKSDNIDDLNIDTLNNPELFFSYRFTSKNNVNKGRQLSAILIRSN